MISGKLNRASLAAVESALRSHPRRLYPPLQTEFVRWGVDWQNAMISRFTGKTGPTSFRNRSSRLRDSSKFAVDGNSLGNLQLRLYSQGADYARAHEFGGTILPKRGKYLMWPADPGPAIDPSGRPKYTGAMAFGDAHVAQTFFRKSRKDPQTLLLFVRPLKKGRKKLLGRGLPEKGDFAKGAAELAFIGRKSVTLPGPKSSKGGPSRLGFHDEWRKLGPTRSRGLIQVARKARLSA